MLAKEITSLGMAGFIMQGTNCLVQVVCNATLKIYGGDLYVGIMIVINSVRDIVSLPVSGLTSGSQPVLGYNYGAREYTRVKQGICFTALLGILYTVAAWLFIIKKPRFLISVFTEDATMLEYGVSALHLYFFGFFFMAFQFTGQSTFTALGHSRQAIFFFFASKSYYCNTSDYSFTKNRIWCEWSLSCRTDIKCDWRSGMLHNDVVYCIQAAGEAKTDGDGKDNGWCSGCMRWSKSYGDYQN